MKARLIKWEVKWKMPYTNEPKTSAYKLTIPNKVSRMWYWWLAEGQKGKLKIFCFLKRINKNPG